MQAMKRFAVYYAPRAGAFADRAARWLGRDPVTGAAPDRAEPPGLPCPAAEITREPRRYGFHGTIRAPFRPRDGVDPAQIADTVEALARRLGPVACDGLRLETLHGFLALTPVGCGTGLSDLAAAVVEATDGLRAPLTEAEIARRQPGRLTPRQRALLDRWGYPYVMEEFRFHLTLTDRLPAHQAGVVADVLAAHFAPVLPRPFVIEDLCLFGEDAAGSFHLLHRHGLAG